MTNAEIIAEFRALFLDGGLSLETSLGIVIKRGAELAKYTHAEAPKTEAYRAPALEDARALWNTVVPAVAKARGVRLEAIVGHRSVRCHCNARHVAWHALHALGVNQVAIATIVGRHRNVVCKGIARIDKRESLRISAEAIVGEIRERGRVTDGR